MEKLYFNTVNLIINAPINFFLFVKLKKEFREIKLLFNKYKLWGNSQLENIICIDQLLNANKIENDLAEIIFKTYLGHMKISRVEAMRRALFTYDQRIFNHYYNQKESQNKDN